MGGRDFWMSFLAVENLDDSDQFILGCDFVRNFDVTIYLNNGLTRIRNPDRKYVKRPIKRIITDENKVPIFLDGKLKLQPEQAVLAKFRTRKLNSLSDSKQVFLVPNQRNLVTLCRWRPTMRKNVHGKNGGRAWRKAEPGGSGGRVDMEGPQNGPTTHELPGVCQLLP